jgi:hypothetical protein
MAIQVGGTTVISDTRVLSSVTGLKTVGGASILGSGDIATGGSTTAGAVGTYAMMQRTTGSGILYEGSTIAGSSVAYSNVNWSSDFTRTASGTWQVMGYYSGSGHGSTNYISVCVRIS